MSEWYPGDPANPITGPAYIMHPVVVVDSVALRLKWRTRRRWRLARDLALSEWAPVDFRAIEVLPKEWPPTDLYTLAINLFYGEVGGNSGGYVETNPLFPNSPYGYAQVNAYNGLDKPTMRYLIAHEVGHALGFWHGGDGVMCADPYLFHAHPNAEELSALENYYP